MSTLKHLNKVLFEQLDRLNTSSKENLESEVQRANAIKTVSEQIIDAHNTQLEAVKLVASYKGMDASQKTLVIEG